MMLLRLLVVLAVVVLLGGGAALVHRALTDPPQGPLGEYQLPDENILVSRLIASGVAVVNANKTRGVYHRDAHPKTHGCVDASFIVKSVAPPLNQSIFASPRRYDAKIRFSNGDPTIQSDWKRDARGMAIKVLTGANDQDFIMIDNPVFMLRNIQEYEQFSAWQTKSTIERKPNLVFGYFLLGPDDQFTVNPFHWRLRELVLGNHIRRKPSSLLLKQFHSMTAYRLGNAGYIKFSAKPVPCVPKRGFPGGSSLDSTDDDALGHDLQTRVGANSYCFDFLIQRQRTDRNMPVEDATVEWKESDSPFVPVARLEIHSNSNKGIEATPNCGDCENLSFSPWSGAGDIVPVGSLNRARKAVYEGISAYRHSMNGLDGKSEPTAAASCPPTKPVSTQPAR